MLRQEFEMWLVGPLSNTTLIIICIYVIKLSYIEDRFSYFTKLSDSGMEELNRILVGLDIAAVILETDN